jgi:hypothetical protein
MILMTREMNSSARMFRLNICFIRPSRLPIQESMISRFCFCFSYACHQPIYLGHALPPKNLAFFREFADFHSFPEQRVHEILVRNTAYMQHTPPIDPGIQPTAIDRRNSTTRSLHMSFPNTSPCKSESRSVYDTLPVNQHNKVTNQT